MKKPILFSCVLLVLLSISCNTEKKKNSEASDNPNKVEVAIAEKKISKADSLINDAIEAHGGHRYENASYGFTFRDNYYTFENGKDGYTYTLSNITKGDTLKYILENGKLTHNANGTETELSSKDIIKYTENVNSVVYFATLPHKLNDRAVNKVYEGATSIKNRKYEVVGITFDQKGGGVDFDDEFMYWINNDTNTIDYLAYNYETNDGGVRFRTAYNPQSVGGIRFQDYVNYKAEIGTPLEDLPALYEKNELQELSRIEIENIKVLKD